VEIAGMSDRPNLPPQIPQYFFPSRGSQPAGAKPLYRPAVCGVAEVIYRGTENRRHAYLADIGEITLSWDAAKPGDFDENEMEKEPSLSGSFVSLPAPACKPQSYKAWERDFAGFIYRTSEIQSFRNPDFKLSSNPAESESDFRIRVSQVAREKRDLAVEALRRKYGPKITVLEDKIRRAEQRIEKEKADVRQVGVQTAVSLGATLLGAFMGRKTFSATNISRASGAIRGGMRTAKEKTDVAAASENLDVLQQQRADLEAELNSEIQILEGTTDPQAQKIDTVSVRPKKADVSVRLVALVWLPHWHLQDGSILPAYQ
jgi:hypothetical protein